MSPIRVIAIPTIIAEQVRATSRSPQYGHPAHIEPATGRGPCRHCLRTFRVGEEQRTLFTYNPFDGVSSVPLPGPVFIHTESCDRYPEDGGYPEDLRTFPVILNAYGHASELIRQILADPGEAEKRITDLLNDPGVQYVEVRDRKAGCFDFRVERD